MSEVKIPGLTGGVVTKVRRMTKAELEREGWEDMNYDQSDIVIELDNGLIIYPSRDPEGNGPGTMFGHFGDQAFYVREEN